MSRSRPHGDRVVEARDRGERTVYASATFSAFFVFQRSCAALTFLWAVSAVKGGTIGADMAWSFEGEWYTIYLPVH